MPITVKRLGGFGGLRRADLPHHIFGKGPLVGLTLRRFGRLFRISSWRLPVKYLPDVELQR